MVNVFSEIHISRDFFEGPLDLLVHLVQKKEIPSDEFSLVELFKSCPLFWERVDQGAHFIELFTQLLVLKSRHLLPDNNEVGEVVDTTPKEAMEHLFTYCEIKQVALDLKGQWERSQQMFVRGTKPPLLEGSLDMPSLSLEDLAEVFKKLAKKLPTNLPTIEKEKWQVLDGIRWIQGALGRQGSFALLPFLRGMSSTSAFLVTFLALLEMMKKGLCYVTQDLRVKDGKRQT